MKRIILALTLTIFAVSTLPSAWAHSGGCRKADKPRCCHAGSKPYHCH